MEAPLQENEAYPQRNQDPYQKQAPKGDQALIIPPSMKEEEIKFCFLCLTQSMTIKTKRDLLKINP